MYSARITTSNPSAIVILIDQSGSMNELTKFNNEIMLKSEAVSLVVNMLITELLNRSKRKDGYRDYFDIAVLGYHEDSVKSILGDDNRPFVKLSKLVGTECREKKIQKERRLPDGNTSIAIIHQKVWIEPMSSGKTPMCTALERAYELSKAWCEAKAHQNCYPPTIFNITDGEATDGDDLKLCSVADRIKTLKTNDGEALLINIHITADTTAPPVLFPSSLSELPKLRYAEVLFRTASVMPQNYTDSITTLNGKTGEKFRGVACNAAMTDLFNLMNIGSVSVTTLD